VKPYLLPVIALVLSLISLGGHYCAPTSAPAQAQGSRDPLGDCVKDCRRRGAKEATYTGYPYPAPGIPEHTCACTFGLIEEKHE
jgi:hypothetical protein